ncbi:MAG: DUF120 domain-containing protein [Candidatus Thorarchaeota archaeon]
MISPDNWFTLYTLAKDGAIHRRCNITTSELGERLDVSQQTASRRLTSCVEEGLIERSHTANGMLVKITERGKKQLIDILNGLEVAFAPPSEDIIIRGEIVDGIGEGAYYVDMYSKRFKEALGFEPYSGTLNVRVTDETSRQSIKRMKHSTPLVVPGFSHKERTFGDVICYRARIEDRVEGAIVIAQRTHHSPDILEVIAPVNLRDTLGLEDEDEIKLRVVPLHMAT